MIDSLTVSILLFVALAIGAVVARDAWRAWRLRQLAVREASPPQAPIERSVDSSGVPSEPRKSPVPARGEPSLGFPPVVVEGDSRAEPQLPDMGGIDPDPSAAPSAPGESVARRPSDAGQPGRAQTVESGAAPFDYIDSRPLSEPRVVVEPAAGPVMVGKSVMAGSTLVDQTAVAPNRVEEPRTVASAPGPAPMPRVPAEALADGSVLSDRTDCIALLRFIQPLAAEKLVSMGQILRRSGSKPVMLEVLSEPSLAEGWHVPRAGELCSAARFGLLLANRAGPLNALEYTDFAQRIREVAATLGVGVELADMAGTLSRARSLDAESARLDAQVCIHVDASETLGPAQLAALSGPLAVVERGNNRYARLGPRGETLFSVALGEQSNRLSFLLDVPRVDPSSKPFAAMIESVRISARRLPGKIIDDSGKPLSDRGIDAITAELEQRYAALAVAGLTAGSPAALRVFN